MVRLEESFQDLGLGDSQCGAPQVLSKIVPSFTKMSTLRLELPVLDVQRGAPYGFGFWGFVLSDSSHGFGLRGHHFHGSFRLEAIFWDSHYNFIT